MSATDYFIGELYRTKALRWISVGNKKLTSRIRRTKPAPRRLGPFWRAPISCACGEETRQSPSVTKARNRLLLDLQRSRCFERGCLVAACCACSFWPYATPPAALLCPAFTRVSHARCALNFKANRRIRACFFICERFHSSRPAQTRYCAEFK